MPISQAFSVGNKPNDYSTPQDFGAAGDGVTDDTTAFTSLISAGGNIHIPAGLYRITSPLSTSAAEEDALLIEGAGMSNTVLMFESGSGVSLLGTGNTISNLSIVDGNSYSTKPTSTTQAIQAGIVQGNITPGTVGLRLDRNHTRATNVLVMGFAEGRKITNTKFYMVFDKVRTQKNLTGMVCGSGPATDTPNFSASHDCYDGNNFEKNIHLISGFHQFTDCSSELCDAYDANNSNYPNGGIMIEPSSRGIFERCYWEEINVYNFSQFTKVHNPQNIWNMLTFAPSEITSSHNGIASKNLVTPSWVDPWSMSGATIDTSSTNLEDGSRYAEITVNGGSGTAKIAYTEWNTDVLGMLPRSASNIAFKVFVGFKVKLETSNFTTEFPFFRLQMEDAGNGRHTGNSNASVLTDNLANYTTNSLVGDTITNVTDGSSGTVTANTATTITATLSGGTNNDWDFSDQYTLSDKQVFYAETPTRTMVFSDDAFRNDAADGNGTATDTGTNLLIDSGANFTSYVCKGALVYNLANGKRAFVQSVDSDTQLTLSDDIFDSTSGYWIKAWQYIGAFFSVRNTFVTGNPLNRLRLELTLESQSVDCSASNRILKVSDPEVRILYETKGKSIAI